MYAKSDEMLRFLAEHGEKLERGPIPRCFNSALKDSRPFTDLVAELGAVKEEPVQSVITMNRVPAKVEHACSSWL